jgi:hypothetical protein
MGASGVNAQVLRALVDVTALVALVQCGVWGQPHTTREKGTTAGGVLGAGTGAILGATVAAPELEQQ